MRSPLSVDDDPADEPNVNLTPLIDVVFVVLITFIMIAPLVNVDQVELASSGPDSKPETPTSTSLSITVKADNTIWMKGVRVSLSELPSRLKQEKTNHPQAVAQLVQDRRAQFGTYQEVKNALETAGYERLDIVLK